MVYGKGNRKLFIDSQVKNTNSAVLQLEENYYHIANDNNLPVDTNYINASLDYSFSTGTSIQAATYNCPLSGGGAQNFECDTYINIMQSLNLYKNIYFHIGSQNGTVFDAFHKWHNAEYTIISFKPISFIRIHGGSYFVNKDLSVTTNVFGYITGLNISLSDNWNLSADYSSGNNNLSGSTINLYYKYYYLGVGIPEHNSGNEFYGAAGIKIDLLKILGK
jgi:hypothetical protein